MTNERILYMNIQTISKEKKEVMVELTADDLGIICNALYAQKTYADMVT